MAVMWEDGILAMLDELKGKDWGEEKNWRGAPCFLFCLSPVFDLARVQYGAGSSELNNARLFRCQNKTASHAGYEESELQPILSQNG